MRARDLDLSSNATAFSPALERAISPHACLVPCQRAQFRHNPLPGATFATRIPACMLTQSASCHRLLVRRKLTSHIKDRCNHRPDHDLNMLTEHLAQILRRTRTGWVRSSSSRSSSSRAAGRFLHMALEVRAHLQHTTARPAHMPRDPGASHARAHWKAAPQLTHAGLTHCCAQGPWLTRSAPSFGWRRRDRAWFQLPWSAAQTLRRA